MPRSISTTATIGRAENRSPRSYPPKSNGTGTKSRRSHAAHSIALGPLTALIYLLALGTPAVRAQTNVTSAPAGTNAVSKFRSPDDGWLDVSSFLGEQY